MSLLPAGYKRLEYIEATGTQYIKTGFKPTQNTRAHCAITCPPTGGNWMFGARKGGGDSQFGFVYSTGGYYLAAYNTVQTQFDKSMNSSDKIIVNANKNITTLFANGATASVTATVGTFTSPVELILFGCNTNGTISYGKGRVYLFELYEAGLLIRYYIPAKNPSGVVGLYDIANGVFYSNSGTGVFTAGPEITDVDDAFKQVEYIQSSGTQYVDTGFKPNQNTRVVMDAQMTVNPASGDNPAYFAATDNSKYFRCIKGGTAATLNWEYGTTYNLGWAMGTSGFTQRRVIDANGRSCTIDGSTQNYSAQTFTLAYSLYLLASNNAGTAKYFANAKLYSTDIYDNGTQVREYVPHVTALGTPGLLDTLNNVFYASVSATDFTAGPEIIKEWKLVEWVQATGVQYVDTLFKPNQLTRMVAEVQPASTGAMAISAVDAGWLKNGFGVYTNTSEFGTSNYGITASAERRVFELNKGQLSVGGKALTTMAGTFQSAYNLVIFALNRSGTTQEYFSGKLYRYALYDNGVLLYGLKPCRLLDGRVGLVDESSGAFFASASATPLIAGPDLITVPLAPEGLTANVSFGVLTLSWTASEDAEGYDVYRNGAYVATTFDTTFTDTINPATAYEYGVTAYNEHGESEMSTVAVPATQRPEQVTDLRAMDAGFNYITLTWDNVAGADAYRVYRNGVLLSEQKEAGYSDSGLKTETAYTYGVSAVNEVGESATAEITVSTTEFKLVTDRTSADVQRALDFSKALPTENMEEWLAGMKGSYNAFDLNRVELAVLYVIERLRIAGWYITVESKTDWKFSDFPTVSEMTRYLNNIRKLRSALPKGLPSVPADMGGFTYNEANDIERLLEMLDAAVTNIMANVSYSNELYSGEVM